jgi:phage shock protein A
MVELQKARDQNERLDGEIRVLRERVRALDTEKKTLLDKVSIHQTLINALISLNC